MADTRSKKISVLIFLFAIFVLLVVMTASWIFRVYHDQTAFSEQRTFATIECGRYYFDIKPESVSYDNGTLYFEMENTLGKDIDNIVVESSTERKEVSIALSQGVVQPVSLPIEVTGWVLVYPVGCEDVNFRNLSFGLK
jgi:hypothetical protein